MFIVNFDIGNTARGAILRWAARDSNRERETIDDRSGGTCRFASCFKEGPDDMMAWPEPAVRLGGRATYGVLALSLPSSTTAKPYARRSACRFSLSIRPIGNCLCFLCISGIYSISSRCRIALSKQNSCPASGE